LRPVGDLASAVENVSATYSDTTVAAHEYFDQTGYAFGIKGGHSHILASAGVVGKTAASFRCS
jgi:hypothetical protein